MAKLSKDPSLAFRVPSWASFFMPGEYADFLQLVSSDLRRRDLPAFIEDGFVILKHPGKQQEKMSLLNLAQTCRGAERAKWRSTVAEFFDSMLRLEEDAQSILEQMRDLDRIRSKIKVRLHGEDYLSHPQASLLVLKKVAPGISALLVCDHGFANVSVPSEFLRAWGVPVEDLFALAVENVRAEGRLVVNEGPRMTGFRVDVLSSRTNYTASHALFFDDYLKQGTGYGAILAIPTRDVIFLHIIRDEGVLGALRFLHTVARDAYSKGPGAISTELYWWRAGQLKLFPTQMVGNALQLIPTEEFETVVFASMAKGN